MIFFKKLLAKIASWKLLEQKITHFYDIALWIPFAIIFRMEEKIHTCFAPFCSLNKEVENLNIFIIHKSERNKEQEKLMKLLIIIAIFKKIFFQHKEHSEMKEYFVRDIIAYAKYETNDDLSDVQTLF